jgi:hypothetical protein
LKEELILSEELKDRYRRFLESKKVIAIERGSDAGELDVGHLLPHAQDISRWMVRGGNRACFAAFGLTKTRIQIQVLKSILRKHDGVGLIVCPLGVMGEFKEQAGLFGIEFRYVRTNAELEDIRSQIPLVGVGHRFFITNYERVRDGDLDPNRFTVSSLDEASLLRSFGSKTYQRFLTLFDQVPFKFVATATPSPNRLKELIHYAGFLGIMDTGQALTRFFKRDSKKAGNLTLHPHKEREFWLWVNTWSTWVSKPSDLGHSDAGYDLPPLNVITHRLPVDHSTAGFDSWGQGRLIKNAALGVSDGAREKRDSLGARVECAKQIVAEGGKYRNWIIWHDLEPERLALMEAFPDAVAIWGSGAMSNYGSKGEFESPLHRREAAVAAFSRGEIEVFLAKPSLAGSGCNFQKHCHDSIHVGIGFKFNDFIQSVHRIHRFLQKFPVNLHLIYTEAEDRIYDVLMGKWEQDKRLRATMSGIIKEYGLNNARTGVEMQRSIGIERQVKAAHLVPADVELPAMRSTGELPLWTAVNNDSVLEMERFPDNSVDLVVTSVPFSDHYEYTESFNDYGHNNGDVGFFEQMDFLTPQIVRALRPGRLYCCHTKDRLVYGSVSGLGMYSVNPFSDKCVAHLQEHGLIYCGRITIVTDVVRENSQTYRLGWSENCKDSSKMGVGSPEYVLLFRKLPSDLGNAYADTPIVKSKEEYNRSRWQFDASPFWRSRGNRFLNPDEVIGLVKGYKDGMERLRKLWHEWDAAHVYDFEGHVQLAEVLESKGMLPASFMLLDPTSHSPWVWEDIVRMRTLNAEQSRKRMEMHVCPLQLDVVERLINRYSMPGELVLDPFAGLFTVPYVAVLKGRRGYGIELSSEYWADGVGYCRAAELKVNTPTLFDFTGDDKAHAKTEETPQEL